jgi:Sulfotransferase family
MNRRSYNQQRSSKSGEKIDSNPTKQPRGVIKVELHRIFLHLPSCVFVSVLVLLIGYGILLSLVGIQFPFEERNVQSSYDVERFSMKHEHSHLSRSIKSEIEAKLPPISPSVVRNVNPNLDENIAMMESTARERNPLIVSLDSPPRQPLPNPVQLLRIPKAGSSSFSAFLRYQYNCTSVKFPPGDCTKTNQKRCAAIHGCTNHKIIPNWKQEKNVVPMITFVREPVARYISAYQYQGHHGLVRCCFHILAFFRIRTKVNSPKI